MPIVSSSTLRRSVAVAVLFSLLSIAPVGTQSRDDAPVDVGQLSRIRPLVEEAIATRKLPGAVVLVGRGDRVFYREAIGDRALVPAREAMTTDTIFDVASLTKVVATTTSIVMLIERGRLGLDDPVAAHIPEFGRYGKQRITIRQLMTHTSGLRPDLDLAREFEGSDAAIRTACDEVPVAAPGQRFIYSDINFFLLGEVVRRVSGEPLDRFAATNIFQPLGMRDTMFLPPESLRPRIAPTESCTRLGWPCRPDTGTMLRGVVHDPTARRMGGVAGHAGLFSTADDLSRFCRMLLGGGWLGGVRVLSPLGVALMTHAATASGFAQVRALGWDIDSRYASNRGDLFPIGSFGHTGWTGTSLWMDPVTGLYVIFLSNRVHPDGKGDVGQLRARVASVVAAAAGGAPIPPGLEIAGHDFGPQPAVHDAPRQPVPVLTGIDVLRGEQFASLRGRRVALLTNETGRTREGTSTIDVLRTAPGVTLVALFSPEHGIQGKADEAVASSRDNQRKLPIYSLYGETRRPTAAMLAGVDTIVVDLQDVGVRFYTYTTTVGYILEEAAARHLKVVVLDRPNPINGFAIEGPVADQDALGFTAYYPMPTRHGLTLGELARLFNGEKKIGADLTVVPMRNWSREEWFDETGLEWVNPSPNMRSMNAAVLYPGIGSIEGANISVGRGTDTPFEQVGAPWIDGRLLAGVLNARTLPGIRFYPVRFTPSSSKYAGEECRGISMIVTDREALQPVRVGIEIASAIARLYARQFEPNETWRLLGSRALESDVLSGKDPADIGLSWGTGESKWREMRAKYLLYY
jgi:uncharacterized protein YbbC (DUF1343 family)/CubicO group peptidase (beta-lactamase class C family)